MKGSKFKPILFNTEMVKAILEGRKTQTRRLIKLTPGLTGRPIGERGNPDNKLGFMYPCGIKWPPFNKDDVLWVRETWLSRDGEYFYKADDEAPFGWYRSFWNPSIHMPKEAARIFLRVKDVWVERLKDIHEKYEPGPDNPVMKEGLRYLSDFIALWDSTIKPADRDRYGWEANPWVWVIEFEQCAKPEGWLRYENT